MTYWICRTNPSTLGRKRAQISRIVTVGRVIWQCGLGPEEVMDGTLSLGAFPHRIAVVQVPHTLHPTPSTLHPAPRTLNPEPATHISPPTPRLSLFAPRPAMYAPRAPSSPHHHLFFILLLFLLLPYSPTLDDASHGTPIATPHPTAPSPSKPESIDHQP